MKTFFRKQTEIRADVVDIDQRRVLIPLNFSILVPVPHSRNIVDGLAGLQAIDEFLHDRLSLSAGDMGNNREFETTSRRRGRKDTAHEMRDFEIFNCLEQANSLQENILYRGGQNKVRLEIQHLLAEIDKHVVMLDVDTEVFLVIERPSLCELDPVLWA